MMDIIVQIIEAVDDASNNKSVEYHCLNTISLTWMLIRKITLPLFTFQRIVHWNLSALSLSLSDPSMGQSPTSCQVSGLSAHADGDGVFVAEFQLEMVKWGSWAWRGLHVSKGSAKAVHFHQNIIRYTSLYHIYICIHIVYIHIQHGVHVKKTYYITHMFANIFWVTIAYFCWTIDTESQSIRTRDQDRWKPSPLHTSEMVFWVIPLSAFLKNTPGRCPVTWFTVSVQGFLISDPRKGTWSGKGEQMGSS